MRKSLFLFSVICFVVLNIVCTKPIADKPQSLPEGIAPTPDSTAPTTEAVGKTIIYIIKKGAHYCDPNPLTFTSKSKISFTAVFDSSCIYQTVDPANQNDINFTGFLIATHSILKTVHVLAGDGARIH